MKHLTIARRIAALTGGGLVVLVIVGLLGVWSTSQMGAAADDLASVPGVIRDVSIADMNHDASGLYLGQAAVATDAAARTAAVASAEEALAAIPTLMESALAAHLDADVDAAITAVGGDVDAYVTAAQAYGAIVAERAPTADEKATFDAAFNGLADALPTVSDEVETHTADEMARAQSVESRGKLLLVVLSLLSIVICAVMSVAIGRSIVRPVKRTADVLDAVAAGDLGQRLPDDSHDELGQMATSLNTALTRLSAAMVAIGDHAGSLASSSEELTSVSSQLASTAHETSQQATLVSAAAEQVSANVSTVAAGTGEMTASIQDISHNAQDAVGVASNAVHMAVRPPTTRWPSSASRRPRSAASSR